MLKIKLGQSINYVILKIRFKLESLPSIRSPPRPPPPHTAAHFQVPNLSAKGFSWFKYYMTPFTRHRREVSEYRRFFISPEIGLIIGREVIVAKNVFNVFYF